MLSDRALKGRIERYFAQEEGVKSLAGLALSIGTDSRTLAGMLGGGDGAAELIGMAMTRIEKDIVENGLKGKYNATMSAFLLKTVFGYSEKDGQAAPGDVKVEMSDELAKYAV